MTKQDLINQIQDELTIHGSLPRNLPDGEVSRVIDQIVLKFKEEYQYSVQKQSYIVRLDVLKSPQFKATKKLIMPDNVMSVVKVQECNGWSYWGSGVNQFMSDKEYGNVNFLAYEVFATAFSGDGLIMRVAQESMLDISRAFYLEQISYDYNKLNHILKLEGREARYSVFIDTWCSINLEDLFDDYLFIRFCTETAKLSYARLLTLYQFSLPGGITIDGSSLNSEASVAIESLQNKLDENNVCDWFLQSNL